MARSHPNYTAIGAGLGGFYATATPGPTWKHSVYRGAAYTGFGALAGMGVGAVHRQIQRSRRTQVGSKPKELPKPYYNRMVNGKQQRVRKGRR